MKKSYLIIGICIALLAVTAFNSQLNIDNKMHYFGNGIVFGIALVILIRQIFKRNKPQKG